MNAIIYTTNTGSAKEYAELLSHETGIPAYSLSEAKGRIASGSDIIYIGWVMASTVKGCAKADKLYNIRAVCAVGMCRTGTQTENIRQKNSIRQDIPLFTLQGNLNVDKLRGIYRPMMKIMVKNVGQELSAKKDRTPDEDDMLDMMLHGENRVNIDNLKDVLGWYKAQK